jgi:hypothetical protein
LVAAGRGARFDANRGAMKEWLSIAPAAEADWTSLAEEALGFVRGGSGKAGAGSKKARARS